MNTNSAAGKVRIVAGEIVCIAQATHILELTEGRAVETSRVLRWRNSEGTQNRRRETFVQALLLGNKGITILLR
jgi:hypothetical protein